MTIMMTELYDALRSAEGVSDDQARRAAEAVAAFDARFSGIERRIDKFQGDVERRFDQFQGDVERRFTAVETRLERRMDAIKGETDLKIEDLRGNMRVMQWMLASLVAGTVALLIKAFA